MASRRSWERAHSPYLVAARRGVATKWSEQDGILSSAPSDDGHVRSPDEASRQQGRCSKAGGMPGGIAASGTERSARRGSANVRDGTMR